MQTNYTKAAANGWKNVEITPGYLLVMLTSALENCSSVTESGTEKETLASEKQTQFSVKKYMNIGIAMTKLTFLLPKDSNRL